MKIESKRFGIRSKSTLKKNAWDGTFQKFETLVTPIDENGKPTGRPESVKKRKGWERLEKIVNDGAVVLKSHDRIQVRDLSTKTEGWSNKIQESGHCSQGDGRWERHSRGRHFVNEKVIKPTSEIRDEGFTPKYKIETCFENGEYPLFREYRTGYNRPCGILSCYGTVGAVWTKKGMGDKSKMKTKGMYKVKQKTNTNVNKLETCFQ
jgi:hypothetical protein